MPLVAMTREMGSLGRDVAAGIAQRNNRKVVYHEIIDQLANKMRLRKSHVERFLDGKSGLWERLTTDKTSLSIFTAEETFRILGSGEAAVIRGWGAAHLLGGIPHVVRVRVCAPLELRVDRMMERLGTQERDAVKSEILLSEEAHAAITRRHFGINWRDPEHYDVVLSTERLTVDECVEEIESVMRRPMFQETPESIRIFNDRALEWAVRSALRRDASTAALDITVEVDRARVALRGVATSEEQAEAAGKIARAMEGVAEVANELKSARGSAYRRD